MMPGGTGYGVPDEFVDQNSRASLEFHSSMARAAVGESSGMAMAEQGESSSSACEATERQACADKKVTLCA